MDHTTQGLGWAYNRKTALIFHNMHVSESHQVSWQTKNQAGWEDSHLLYCTTGLRTKSHVSQVKYPKTILRAGRRHERVDRRKLRSLTQLHCYWLISDYWCYVYGG